MSYLRVSLRGRIGSGEVWSVNPAFNETTNVASWDQAEGQTAVNAIAAVQVPAILRNLASSSGPGVTVRLERRTDAGVLVGAAEANWTGFGTPTAGADKPAQTSIVISLRSDVPGARGRGRIYWPALACSVSPTSLRLSTPAPADIASSMSNYLDLIETAIKEKLYPSPSLIDAHLTVVSPTSGTRTDIKRIQVGDVLDVQRRRRDKLKENYASVAYP